MSFLSKLFGPREIKEPEVWPTHIDDANFRSEVLRSPIPVLLDVWGPGCPPCKQLEPIVIRLAKRYQSRVKVAELNAAESPDTAIRLGVQGTPTVLYFKNGREFERVVGFRGELYHQEVIEQGLLEPGAPQTLTQKA